MDVCVLCHTKSKMYPNSVTQTDTYWVCCVDELPWLTELNQTLLQVIKRSFNQDLMLLVVGQKVIPQWVT